MKSSFADQIGMQLNVRDFNPNGTRFIDLFIYFCHLCFREGKGDISRTRLIDRLQSYLPPQIMLPPRRLRCLLKQAVQYQADSCSCHDVAWRTDLDNISLLTDHDCGTDSVSVKMPFGFYHFKLKFHRNLFSCF